MSEKITVIDYSKIGKKGYPYSWKELGIQPPTKIIEKFNKLTTQNTEVTFENKP
jgi:hypothetical protein